MVYFLRTAQEALNYRALAQKLGDPISSESQGWGLNLEPGVPAFPVEKLVAMIIGKETCFQVPPPVLSACSHLLRGTLHAQSSTAFCLGREEGISALSEEMRSYITSLSPRVSPVPTSLPLPTSVFGLPQ